MRGLINMAEPEVVGEVLGCQSSLSTCTSVVGRGLGMLFL